MKSSATLYHASHTHLHISSFYTAFGYQIRSSLYSKLSLWNSCLANCLVTLKRVFNLHSRNVLVFLELGHGVRLCIIIDLSILLGTHRIHIPF